MGREPTSDKTAQDVLDTLESLDSDEWQILFDNVEGKIFLVSDDFKIIFANEAVRSAEPGTLEGRTCHEAFHGIELPCRGCPVTMLLGAVEHGEPPPTRRCNRVRSFPLRREQGRPKILAVEMMPRDELKSMPPAAPKAWLSEILRDWGAPVVATSPDGTILVLNEEAEDLLGYKAETIVGQLKAAQFLAEREGRDLHEKLHSEGFGGKGKLFSESIRLVHACGHTVPVTLRGAVLSDGDEELATVWFLQPHSEGDPAYEQPEELQNPRFDLERTMALQHLAAGLAHQMRNPLTGTVLFSNVLMQELVRRELQRADAFLWNLIQSSVDAIIATDTKGNIFIFNDEACEVLGYKPDEVVGQSHITQLYPIEEAREIMRKLRADDHGGKGKLIGHLMQLIHKNSEHIPVRLNASLVYVNGQEFGSVGFFQDQRERIKMSEELKQTQVQLLQSEKMASLGKLSAGIAHQINNPLSGIVLFSNLLIEDLEMAKFPEWAADLKRIADEAERCRSIVKELLEFARQTDQKVKTVNLNRALGQTIFLLEKQVLFHNIIIVRLFQTGLPEIWADPQQLNHVFMNLILNAAEAMEGRGTLTLRTRTSETLGCVEFEVSDTGCGIPDEIRSRVFEPFFTTKEVGKGTGLGLSMVYGIVERHGGKVMIDSAENEGTVFTVRLPIGESLME